MSDIRRSIKILLMKNRVWLAMLFILAVFAMFFNLQGSIQIMEYNLKEVHRNLDAYEKNIPMPTIYEMDHKELTISKEDYVSKEDFQQLNEKIKKAYGENDKNSDKTDEYFMNYTIFLEEKGLIDGANRNSYDRLSNVKGLNGYIPIFENQMLTIFIAFVLGILLSSMEHITSFYSFIQSLPWPRWKTYIGRYIIGLITLLIILILGILMNYLLFKNSGISELIIFESDPSIILGYILKTIGSYGIVLGSGMLCGSFVGHLGMLIVVFGYLDILLSDIGFIIELFTGETYFGLIRFKHTFDQLPILIRTLIQPVQGLAIDKNIILTQGIGLLIVSIIYLLIGVYRYNRGDKGRSGVFILNPYLSKIIEILAIITTSAFIVNMLSFTIIETQALNIGLFIISLIISYKFYHFLFKVRIGI